jgi:Toprim-like
MATRFSKAGHTSNAFALSTANRPQASRYTRINVAIATDVVGTANPDTILKLGKEGSLGWAGDALAFIYPKGVKFRRWPAKEFYWEAEGPSLWRGQRMKTAKHIYITESETDAISAIDSGVEVDDSIAVVAVSGVNSFLTDWVFNFKGKSVTLAFDNDEAGQKMVKQLVPLFCNRGVEVRLPKFEEVPE